MAEGMVNSSFKKSLKGAIFLLASSISLNGLFAQAISLENTTDINEKDEQFFIGGGYAVTKQISGAGYSCEIYNAEHGLPTSDANYVFGSSDGHVWIGGYAGIFRYDGMVFEKLPPASGFTSGRGFFEDSKNRIWVATNDNGVVVVDGDQVQHFTYRDGLPSSSIRVFAEDKNENIFIGTTSGLAYVDKSGKVNLLSDKRLDKERILRLDSDFNGRVYGQTKNGAVFLIEDCRIKSFYTGRELGMGKITTLLADHENAGKVYLGTENNYVYYGVFGSTASRCTKIDVSPLKNIHWLSWDCSRVWVTSTSKAGYIDDKLRFHELNDIPMNSSIEMTCSDYQGNMWFASATQGVMKIVTNNFVNLTAHSDLQPETVNASCLHNGMLYIGTDGGLRILNKNNKNVENSLTEYIGNTRIRCIIEDKNENLWIATYTNNRGLICQKKDGSISAITTKNGLLSNQVRCLCLAADGKILAGTNAGLAIISNFSVIKTYGIENGIKNPEFLTVCETSDGSILCGSDGDGIYVIKNSGVHGFDGNFISSRIGRDEGLTSDVVMRIKKDDKNGVCWIVTSNSLQYVKDGIVKNIKSFPYNNNYDIYLNDSNEAWVLSSHGIYTSRVEDMLFDSVTDYKIFTLANGLPCQITGNSYSALDSDGNLFIAGREGVFRVNINEVFDEKNEIKLAVNSIYCDGEKINASPDGVFYLPSSKGRIKLSVSVMDYTLENPFVRVFLEGSGDTGLVARKNALTSLEYTSLPYGKHVLHIQILDGNRKNVLYEKTFDIIKKPRLSELFVFRFIIFTLAILLSGFMVWRIMQSTVISRQYVEIQQAKENAERASKAKSRFLSHMSQEIITPINTIFGMNEMIMREDSKNVPKSYFMSIMNYSFDIKKASETLQTLVNELFELTKIETGTMELAESEYDVQEMLRTVVMPVRARTGEKAIQFDIVVDEMVPTRLCGDVGKIRQVLLKLLTNAVKYTDEGRVELKLTMEERIDDVCGLCFTVSDTGIGIRQEEVEELFSAYSDGSIHTKTGLGLDISRKFAELMGGVLVCRSTYGEGSEFIFTLRQKIADITPLGTFSEIDTGKEARGPYIPQFIAPDADVLVADESSENLSVISSLLKATKVFVTTAKNAEECLEKIRTSAFNIAFINQSIIDSFDNEIIERIHEIHPDLNVYVIAENASFSEESYRKKGFAGSLSYPVDAYVMERLIMRSIPEKMMEKPSKGDFTEHIKSWPEELLWLNDVEGLSLKDGEKASGGIGPLIFGLKLFYETIDEYVGIINKAYRDGESEYFKAKVTLLKNSAFLVGALELYKLASEMEKACKNEDKIYIASHLDELLNCYSAFKEKLSKLDNKN